MYEIDTKLKSLAEQGKPVRVSLIGAGQMGREIIAQIGIMSGMIVDVVVDLDIETVKKAFITANIDRMLEACETLEQCEKAIAQGNCVVTTNYLLAIQASPVQVVIDATGSPEMGAKVTLECIFHKKHIIMMNVECDVTVGPLLRRLCERTGIVYSLTAGDEPGSIIEVYRFARAIGLEIIAAGKGKNNPLDIYAHPGMPEWAEKAKARDMYPRMLIEFVDGSKTMIEMCAVSNATGLVPDCRGMHGPNCNVEDLAKVFSLKEQGGILNRTGVVDYGIGNINPGVFVVATTDNECLRNGLVQRDMGPGPNYLLFRPYHLCSCETPISAAQAVIYGESTAHPMPRMTSECITIAKKDLKAGELLDGIGEYCYRASIDLFEVAKKGNMLPVGLAKGAKLKCDIKCDTIITYDMVVLPESVLLQLRRIQDAMM